MAITKVAARVIAILRLTDKNFGAQTLPSFAIPPAC
jgi:hypothetical protein